MWFTAHMIVTWRDRLSPLLRKAEKKGDTQLIEALRELRPYLLDWVASIDDVLQDEPKEEE